MNERDRALIETILEGVAVHIDRSIFDYLLANLIEIGELEAESAEPALELYDKAVEGEDMD